MINPLTLDAQPSSEVLAPFEPRGLQKIATAIGMTVMAGASYYGERHGWMTGWNADLRAMGESCAHPILGDIGAFIGIKLLLQQLHGYKIPAGLLGASIINFSVEAGQSFVSEPSPQTNFLAAANQHETIKDFWFALGGAGIYLLQDRSSLTLRQRFASFWEHKRSDTEA